MNLTLTQQPAAFSQIAASSFNTGATLTAALLTRLNENIKFAAARTEEFYGYYINGQTVWLPVSPLDGYQYSRSELSYYGEVYWTAKYLPEMVGTEDGVWDIGMDTDGGPMPTSRGFASGPGQITRCQLTVNQATGLVSTAVTYGGSATGDGVLRVTTIARRMR